MTKRAALVSQNTLNRLFQEANEAWKRCDFETALEIIERAQKRDPANVDILLSLGRMHGQRFDYASAKTFFDRALRLAGHKLNVLIAAARESRNFHDLNLAEHYLKQAVGEQGDSSSAQVMLAEIYERLRRSDEAEAIIDRVLAGNPNHPSALLLRARLHRQSRRLETAEQALRAFPASADPTLRASAAYELGHILDHQGRYDEAMTAFLEAKALLRPHSSRSVFELKVMRARIRHLCESVSSELLKEWFNMSQQLQPTQRIALLGGHPRSGTTLLEQVLDAHPDIISAEETEIFKHDAYHPMLKGLPDDTAMITSLSNANLERLALARKNYFRSTALSLGEMIGERLLIDKNPTYTQLVPALIRIFPEIKFLIALRDPRDVVISCFMQDLPLNQVGAACLTLAGTVEEYAAVMHVWQAIKPRMANPYLEVRYEDMVEDLESVARKALEFFGAHWDANVLGFDEHAQKKTVRSPTYADVTQPVYKRAKGRWLNYQIYFEPHLKQLEPFVKAFGYE